MANDLILCVCCPVLRQRGKPHLPRTPQCCDWCRMRLAADLTALPETYALVDAEPTRAMGEIRSRAFESRPPLNITALSLLGPGTDTPPARLDFWVQDWAGMLNQALPGPTVVELCAWLMTRLSWACDTHPAVDEFAHDIRELTGQLRVFAVKDRGERVGNCPRQFGDDRCNTPLYVDPYVDEIECSRCHMKWKRRAGEWMHLRGQQLAAGVESVEAA